MFVSFAAFSALENLLPCVLPHVRLQVTIRYTFVVALVTLEWLFFCMFMHMYFQIANCCTGILTHCASVRLFPQSGIFCAASHYLKVNCRILALIALLWLLPSVFQNVLSKKHDWSNIGTACTSAVFPSVNELVTL